MMEIAPHALSQAIIETVKTILYGEAREQEQAVPLPGERNIKYMSLMKNLNRLKSLLNQ